MRPRWAHGHSQPPKTGSRLSSGGDDDYRMRPDSKVPKVRGEKVMKDRVYL